LKKITPLTAILCSCVAAASLNFTGVAATVKSPAPSPIPAPAVAPQQFSFKDLNGNLSNAPLVGDSAKRKLTKAVAPVNPDISPALTRAATIAQDRAHASSKSKCWRYVKQALLAAGAVDSYPQTANAKEAATELVSNYGFQKLPITDPYAAPVGSVLVYTAKGAPGHVELRTKTGFVSDFNTDKPSKRKLIGVFAKG
jgi:hypothetical protein